MSLAGLYSSDDPNWRTPEPLFTKLHDEFEFNIDLAADTDNHLCPAWLGPGGTLEDALRPRHWAWPRTLSGRLGWPVEDARQRRIETRGWLNPPYSKKRKMPIAPWLERSHRTQEYGGLVVAVVPARTDTPWWHSFVMEAREIRLVKGRIHFDPSPEYRAANPDKRSSGNFPSAVVIWDGRGSQTRRSPHVCSWDWK